MTTLGKHKKSWAHNGHRNIALLRSNIGTKEHQLKKALKGFEPRELMRGTEENGKLTFIPICSPPQYLIACALPVFKSSSWLFFRVNWS